MVPQSQVSARRARGQSTQLRGWLRSELALFVAGAVALAFLLGGDGWLRDLSSPWRSLTAFAGLFALIMWTAHAVVRHSEHLAERLGEPYGTLLLTLSVISIEIFTISMVMLKGANNPTLARDAMLAVVMIVLNGLLGLALLLGGLRHKEQQYNLQGAGAFLSVTIALAVLGLIVPNYTGPRRHPMFGFPLEVFLITVAIGLYLLFLVIQTTRHRHYFVAADFENDVAAAHSERVVDQRPVAFHLVLLIALLMLVIFLAEKLATLIDVGLEVLHAPSALGGLVVAILVLTPEGLGGIRAAMGNQMQRAVNILLGSALATLSLTIPAVLIVGLATDHAVILGVEPADQAMLLLSLMVAVVTFSSGRTNILQGAVHLILFLAFLMLTLRG